MTTKNIFLDDSIAFGWDKKKNIKRFLKTMVGSRDFLRAFVNSIVFKKNFEKSRECYMKNG